MEPAELAAAGNHRNWVDAVAVSRNGVPISDAHGAAEVRRVFHRLFSGGAGVSRPSSFDESGVVSDPALLRGFLAGHHSAFHLAGGDLLVPHGGPQWRPVRPVCEPQSLCRVRGTHAADGARADGIPRNSKGRVSAGYRTDGGPRERHDSLGFACWNYLSSLRGGSVGAVREDQEVERGSADGGGRHRGPRGSGADRLGGSGQGDRKVFRVALERGGTGAALIHGSRGVSCFSRASD